MTQKRHTHRFTRTEEAITVLFCLIDDAYANLNPRGRRYESLKRLSDSEVISLVLLRDLSNRDKHRVLNPTLLLRSQIIRFSWENFEDTVDGVYNFIGAAQRLEIGAELMRMRALTTNSNGEVKVAGYIAPEVLLTAWGNVTVIAGVNEMISCVEGVIEGVARLP